MSDTSPPEPVIPISFAARFAQLAADAPDRMAVTIDDRTVTFAELDRLGDDMARHLRSLGVGVDDFVTVAEPNSIEFVVACVACWKLGATPQPVSSRLPRLELEAIIELADPRVVVGLADDLVEALAGPTRATLPIGFVAPPSPAGAESLPDAVAAAWKAPTSGGSTGRPKLIVSGDPSVWDDGHAGRATMIGAEPGGVMIMPGPLYHNGPFIWTVDSLLNGAGVVLLGRFDAEATLAAIERHRGTALYVVPTMMQRISKLDDDVRLGYDVSSLGRLFHLAEPCPRWVKEHWIDWLGPEVVWELYGGTEGQAATVLSGTEWLAHPGSVGLPILGEIVIRDEAGNDLPPGEVGDVWMRWTDRETPPYRYLGAEPDRRDGWECLGDVGWMDADGYLYLADRRKDMILVGGANIYPAEVEAALNAHPAIGSSAVIGLPDDERGNRIHALIQLDDAAADAADLAGLQADLGAFLGERLVGYKIPRSYEVVDEPLRDDAGKVRRAALRQARLHDRREDVA